MWKLTLKTIILSKAKQYDIAISSKTANQKLSSWKCFPLEGRKVNNEKLLFETAELREKLKLQINWVGCTFVVVGYPVVTSAVEVILKHRWSVGNQPHLPRNANELGFCLSLSHSIRSKISKHCILLASLMWFRGVLLKFWVAPAHISSSEPSIAAFSRTIQLVTLYLLLAWSLRRRYLNSCWLRCDSMRFQFYFQKI